MFGQKWFARHAAAIVALAAAPFAWGFDAPANFDRAVLDELNFARTDPVGYAETLREYRTHFRGRVVYAPGDEIGVQSNEGPAAVDEAIAFLDRQRPLAPLTDSPPLARAAGDHTADQGPLGLTGHGGSNGDGLGRRIQRHGVWSGMAAEDISYGAGAPADVVRQLIIDDGVPSRGHRANIFDPTLEIAGVGCGPHRIYRYMCVIDFAGAVVVR
jgi:uncharacterized protein YkwD